MRFLSPWRLVFLLAPLALAVAYVIVQRSRRKTVLRFTSVDLLASVAPHRPGWQRHLGAAGLLAALVLLVVGFAQPTAVVRTPRQRATVILTLDVSGSMTADDVEPTRLVAAKGAARKFIDALPGGIQLGLVSFSSTASVVVTPTTDRDTMVRAVDNLHPGGGTATGAAIQLALDAAKAAPGGRDGKPAPAAIVLMSDGSPTLGVNGASPGQAVDDATAAAKKAKVRISTIAFGTDHGVVEVGGQVIPVPSDPDAMAQIAKATGGQTFTAKTAGQLRSVYKRIGRTVGYDVHRREITAWFTGFALALVVVAAVAALVWTQRIV